MDINERFIKLSSRIPFPEDLLLGSDVTITVENHRFIGNVVKREEETTQEGSINVVYKIKFLSD